MKQLKTKVLLSAFVLIFALVATIGSTFAWFTVATTVNVESMQLNVSAEDSILIRLAQDPDQDSSLRTANLILGTALDDDLLDASQYKTTLINADITEYYNFVNYKLSPVTAIQTGYETLDPKNLNTMEVSDTNLARALVATVPYDTEANLFANLDQNSATGSFIELNFYLYSQGENTVQIGVTDVTVDVTGITQAVSQDAVVDAVRLAAWKSGTSDGTTYTPSVNPAYIFGNDIDYAFAFQAGLPGYDDTDTFNAIAGANQTLLNAYQTSATLDIHNQTAAIFSLASETPTLVTVRIYVEGWDADTTNAIISAAFNISFKFTIIS